jgi:hypothetical protein
MSSISRVSHRGSSSSLWSVGLVYGIAVFLLLLGQWKPLAFLDEGGEPWVIVLSEAAAGRYRFGDEIVFTSGPLVDFYKHLFNPATFRTTLVVTYFTLALQVVVLTLLAVRSRAVFFALVMLPALIFFMFLRDVLLLLTPFLIALLALGSPERRETTVLILLGAVAAALATLGKFTLFPLSIGLFVLIDAHRLTRRRLPVAILAYAGSLWAAFALLATEGSDLVDFLRASVQVALGYGGAMSLAGPRFDVALYAGLLLAGLAATAALEWRRMRRDGVDLESVLALTALLLFLWITFKLGFVRNDLHVLFSFTGLALGFGVYALARISAYRQGRIAAAMLAAVVVASAFYSHVRIASDPATRLPMSATLAESFRAAATEVRRTARALADPGGWMAERMQVAAAARIARAAKNPLGRLEGSVDALPPIPDALIAAGLDYRPRPTIAEYTTYSRALIDRNRAFLSGPHAPDHIVFATQRVDYRHPALTEGPLWPLLLSRYAPSKLLGDMLLLSRRQAPVGDLLAPGSAGIARLGETMPIEFGSEPVFLSLDVRLTLLGRALDFLFRAPLVSVAVTTADGVERVYRLVPGIAREGFVASPLIESPTEFVRLAEGAGADELRKVTAMRVFSGLSAHLAYEPEIPFRVHHLRRDRLGARHDWSLPADDIAPLAAVRVFRDILAARGAASPGFRAIAQGLFAHPPARFAVPTRGAGGLAVGVGLLPESWRDGNATDGVCFRILDAAGATRLWERCLDPLRIVADRGVARETIALPAGTDSVLAETDCRGDCNWDWSFWSELLPQR